MQPVKSSLFFVFLAGSPPIPHPLRVGAQGFTPLSGGYILSLPQPLFDYQIVLNSIRTGPAYTVQVAYLIIP